MNDLLEQSRLALETGGFGRAVTLLEEWHSEPRRKSPQSLLMHGYGLESCGRFTEALVIYEEALELAREPAAKFMILVHLGELLYVRRDADPGNLRRAAERLEQAVMLQPGSEGAVTRANLCLTCKELRRFRQLAEHAGILRGLQGYRHDGGLYFAEACFYLGRRAEGLQCLDDLVADAAQLDDGRYFWLLGLLVNYGRLEQAQEIIDSAAPGTRDEFQLTRYQSQLFFDAKDYGAVLKVLPESFVRSVRDPASARLLHFFRGRSLDATGDYRAAHECFVTMNDIAADTIRRDSSADVVPRYSGVDLAKLPVAADQADDPYTPVFMIAFPRSGTTLLDTILDTQSGIHTLSEVDAIAVARQQMEIMGRRYPEDLERLDRDELANLKSAYFSYNADWLPDPGAHEVIIDKMPLNILHVPFILSLFPGAKFILSLRHPLDVCLSCFQQDFVLTQEMAHFTSLEGCFQRYRSVMDLFSRYLDVLHPDVHVLRYEELVGDLDAAAAGVFKFIGYEPDEKYREFHLINREKLLRTPSRDQVTQPIYQSARQRWKNYAEFIEPHIDLVKPYLERFGYV